MDPKRLHCVKSVQIRSFFWSVFSRIRTEYGEMRTDLSVFSPNEGKCGPEKTPYLDTFHVASTCCKCEVLPDNSNPNSSFPKDTSLFVIRRYDISLD